MNDHWSIDDLRATIDELKELGQDLAQALLEMHCDCPNYGPCECQRQKAIDAWVEGTK